MGCEFFESAVKTFACAVILDSAVSQLVTTQLIPKSFRLRRVEGQKNSSIRGSVKLYLFFLSELLTS